MLILAGMVVLSAVVGLIVTVELADRRERRETASADRRLQDPARPLRNAV